MIAEKERANEIARPSMFGREICCQGIFDRVKKLQDQYKKLGSKMRSWGQIFTIPKVVSKGN